MATIASPKLQERFIATAKERISRGLGLLVKEGEGGNLAGELHTMGGEAAMVSLPEVARVAWEGEKVARLLGSGSDQQARVTCGRVLRKLRYLVQELSGKPFTPVPVALTGPTGDSHRVLVWACYARFAAGPRAMRYRWWPSPCAATRARRNPHSRQGRRPTSTRVTLVRPFCGEP